MTAVFAAAGGTKRTVIRLAADVLFAFGSAELAPAAKQAIAAVDDQIGSGGTGTVTIEGHTDAIGSDADNRALSERRASAVRSALEAELGSGYSYTSVGFGETKPVAPNTRPDGSDDPDGRALNRRVEIRTGSVEQVPATLEPLPVTRDLADAGLRAEVAGLERHSGYLMALLTVTNPTGQARSTRSTRHQRPRSGASTSRSAASGRRCRARCRVDRACAGTRCTAPAACRASWRPPRRRARRERPATRPRTPGHPTRVAYTMTLSR